MRTNHRNTVQGLVMAISAGLLSAIALAQVTAQERHRDREPGAEPPRVGREGGIPRAAITRERDRREGEEEGVPEVDAQPQVRGAPEFRWVPPRGDWKLGVWAYNTDSGVVITRVAPGSAAARRGLEPGDKIVTIGGYQVGYVGDLLYPLGFELQRQADSRGDVLLLVQNVRNQELVNLQVQLDRGRFERGGRDRPPPFPRPMPLERQ